MRMAGVVAAAAAAAVLSPAAAAAAAVAAAVVPSDDADQPLPYCSTAHATQDRLAARIPHLAPLQYSMSALAAAVVDMLDCRQTDVAGVPGRAGASKDGLVAAPLRRDIHRHWTKTVFQRSSN